MKMKVTSKKSYGEDPQHHVPWEPLMVPGDSQVFLERENTIKTMFPVKTHF